MPDVNYFCQATTTEAHGQRVRWLALFCLVAGLWAAAQRAAWAQQPIAGANVDVPDLARVLDVAAHAGTVYLARGHDGLVR